MLSTQGPGISVADLNHDQLDDFVVTGAHGQPSKVYYQQNSGSFVESKQLAIDADSLAEDVASAFFDANGDGFLDLVIVSGGQEYGSPEKLLQPRLYLNDGKGGLKRSLDSFPPIFLNASCVEAADIDNDGDADLFIGGRVVPGQYGIDPTSYVLINDGNANFSDETSLRFKLQNQASFSAGMVTDIFWTDLNQDGYSDLLIVGEWMPITVMINEKGILHEKTIDFGLEMTNGWWNTIEGGDFDRDGDIDFLVGNLGLNSRLRATVDQPAELFVGDMDQNGGVDHIITYYNNGVQYPFVSKDQLVKQIPSMKKKFLKYDNYKNVKIEDIVSSDELNNLAHKVAYQFASVLLENTGNGFKVTPLPIEAQMFPIFAFAIDDLNDDNNLDALAVGNLYAVQPEYGRYDAGYGITLLGNGVGEFEVAPHQESGFLVKGEGRDIQVVRSSRDSRKYIVAVNNDSVRIFIQEKR
jgi:hypothetical protein